MRNVWTKRLERCLIHQGEGMTKPDERVTQMHDVIVASVFVVMLLAPCVVAAFTGNTEAAEA